jgi:UDP-galactopyranose mutase
VIGKIPHDHLVYTGPIDEFFDYCYGPLPYRSLRFENESFAPDELKDREVISGKTGFWQPAMQVNYPNDEEFTRIVEIKHATGQQCDNTTIVREYPDEFGPGKEAYYPIPTEETASLYKKYEAKAKELPNVSFIGRLAIYRYYNMDQVVGMALAEFETIKKSLFIS